MIHFKIYDDLFYIKISYNCKDQFNHKNKIFKPAWPLLLNVYEVLNIAGIHWDEPS